MKARQCASPRARRPAPLLALLAAASLALPIAAAALGGGGSPPGVDDGPRGRIVLLEDSVKDPVRVARRHADRHGVRLTHVYRHAVKGYAGLVPPGAVDAIAEEPSVRLVEADLPVEALEAEPEDRHDVLRDGSGRNSNFDHDGEDDFRVDADLAVLDKGMWEAPEVPSLNLVHRVDCVNPDPWRELLGGYEHPGGEDPAWEPNERLNEAAEGEFPYGTYGCQDGTGPPFDDQLSPNGGVHGIGVGNRGAMIDGALPQAPGTGPSLGGVAPGARIWSVRVLATKSENFGGYPDPASYPLNLTGVGIAPVSSPAIAVHCGAIDSTAQLPVPSPELALDAEYGQCEAGGSPAAVRMNSCRYVLDPDNTDPPYTATLDIACEEEGDAIETEVLNGESVACSSTIGPQEALEGIELTNVGEGAEAEVELKAQAVGIEYELSGSECGAEAGAYSDGELAWEATLAGAGQAEEQRGVRVAGEASEIEVKQPGFEAQLDFVQDLGTAHVIAGLDWVAARGGQIDVAEMAIGCAQRGHPVVEEAGIVGCDSTVLDEALEAAIDQGVAITVAAGNNGLDAELATPGNNPDAITVSGVTDSDGLRGGKDPAGCTSESNDDERNPSSAHGTLVDIAAPSCAATSGNSGKLSGAVGALASQCDPEDRAGVEFIADTLMAEGDTGEISEGGWKDTSGDDWKEPLLNLRDEEVFDPVLLASPSNEGGVDEEPDPEGCEWRSHQAPSDVDSDGRSDLVTIDAEGGAKVYRGTYEGPHDAPASQGFEVQGATASLEGQLDPALADGKGAYAIDVADVDGDRHADLIAFEGGEGVSVYPGDSEGGFGEPVQSLHGTTLGIDGSEGLLEPIAAADVNGDERADLVARLRSGFILTFLGQADGTFSSTQLTSGLSLDSALQDGEGHYFLDVIDVTGEELDEPEAEEIDYEAKHANADLVTIGTDGTVYVYEGKPSGKISNSPIEAAAIDPIMDDGEGAEPVGLGDVDRDRRADLLTLEGGTLKLYRADLDLESGDFGFEEPTEAYEGEVDSSLIDGEGQELIGLLDFSRDGLADLVSVTEEGEVLTYRANRDRTFAEPAAAAGSIDSLRHAEAGEEPVAERPFTRRLGCGEAGCQWQPPLHTPRFDGDLYPLSVSGEGISKFATGYGYLQCKDATLTGELSSASKALDLEAEHDECHSTQFEFPATVTMNSCRYTVSVRNAGPPYEGALAIACEEEGDAIELVTFKGGEPIDTTKFGPQSGLAGIDLANAGQGRERAIAVDIEATGVEYEDDAGEVHGDGVLSGEATLSGEREEAQWGVYLSGEELPLGFFLEGEESAEEAKQPRFGAEAYPLEVGGSGPLSLETAAGLIECAATSFGGELGEAGPGLSLDADHAGCAAWEEETSYPVSVQTNSCNYAVDVENVGPPYRAGWGIACEQEGDAIEFKVTQFNLNCAKLGPQEGPAGVALANEGEAAERAVAVGVEATGVEYDLYGACDDGAGVHSDGVLLAEASLAGLE